MRTPSCKGNILSKFTGYGNARNIGSLYNIQGKNTRYGTYFGMCAGKQHKYYDETFDNTVEGLSQGAMEVTSLLGMLVVIIRTAVMKTRGRSSGR